MFLEPLSSLTPFLVNIIILCKATAYKKMFAQHNKLKEMEKKVGLIQDDINI